MLQHCSSAKLLKCQFSHWRELLPHPNSWLLDSVFPILLLNLHYPGLGAFCLEHIFTLFQHSQQVSLQLLNVWLQKIWEFYYFIISTHIKCYICLIADGIIPSYQSFRFFNSMPDKCTSYFTEMWNDIREGF